MIKLISNAKKTVLHYIYFINNKKIKVVTAESFEQYIPFTNVRLFFSVIIYNNMQFRKCVISFFVKVKNETNINVVLIHFKEEIYYSMENSVYLHKCSVEELMITCEARRSSGFLFEKT